MTERIFHGPDWFAPNESAWREHLGHLAGQEISALEIGSFEGRSACWMLDNLLTHPDSTLTCVDTWDGKDASLGEKTEAAFEAFRFNAEQYPPSKLTVECGRSVDVLSFMIGSKACPDKFDLVYIDGDHEGLAALTDLVMCWELLKVGGYLVFDDLRWQSDKVRVLPRLAWRAFRAMKPHMEILHEFRQAIVRKAK